MDNLNDFKQYIDHLFGIVITSIGKNTLLSTERYNKFIEFLLIFYRFQFEIIISPEFGIDAAKLIS